MILLSIVQDDFTLFSFARLLNKGKFLREIVQTSSVTVVNVKNLF